MHGILNNGIQYLVQLIGMYEGSTHYIIAWAASMVLLAFCGGRKGRAVFIWPALILLVTVFNPFFIGILFKGEEGQLNGFLPYLWMLPVLIVIPAGAGALASKLPFSVLKVLPFIAVIAFAAYFGVPRPSAYLKLTLPENYHKADTELLTICSYLEVHKKKSGYSAAFEDAPQAAAVAVESARIEREVVLLPRLHADAAVAEVPHAASIASAEALDAQVARRRGMHGASVLKRYTCHRVSAEVGLPTLEILRLPVEWFCRVAFPTRF